MLDMEQCALLLCTFFSVAKIIALSYWTLVYWDWRIRTSMLSIIIHKDLHRSYKNTSTRKHLIMNILDDVSWKKSINIHFTYSPKKNLKLTISPFIWIANLYFSSKHFQNGNICCNCCSKIGVSLNSAANKLIGRNTPKILLLGRGQNVF